MTKTTATATTAPTPTPVDAGGRGGDVPGAQVRQGVRAEQPGRLGQAVDGLHRGQVLGGAGRRHSHAEGPRGQLAGDSDAEGQENSQDVGSVNGGKISLQYPYS